MKLICSCIWRIMAYAGTRLNNFNTYLYASFNRRRHISARGLLVTGFLPVAYFCFIAIAPAQPSGSAGTGDTIGEVRPLRVGDTIPEELWHLPLQVVNHPEGKDTITLNDYRDKKLIILDFWATWCVPCVVSLDSLNLLQKSLANKVHIQPVTYQRGCEAERLMKGRWNLSSAVNDHVMKSYFPHQTVPHQVWIQHNKVRAVTNHTAANAHTVNKVFDDSAYQLPEKRDIVGYSSDTDLSEVAKSTGTPVIKSSVLIPQIDGIPTSTSKMRYGDTSVVRYTNIPILMMYRDGIGTTNNRIIIDSSCTDQLKDELLEKKYIYQLKLGGLKSHLVKEYLIADLNASFGLAVDSQIVHRECFVVYSKPSKSDVSVFEFEEPSHTGYPIDTFVGLLNFTVQWSDNQPIYLNRATDTRWIKEDYSLMQSDPKAVGFVLSKYGFEVRSEIQPIKMYRIFSIHRNISTGNFHCNVKN